MDIEKKYRDIRPGRKWFKEIVISIVFFVLGKALKATVLLDDEARKELEPIPDGFTVQFAVAPSGPYMALQKKDGLLTYLGLKKINADLAMIFKNTEPAFRMLTAQKSFPQVYCDGSLGVNGDLIVSMIFYRLSNIVQFYLWPKIISRLVLKKVPEMTLQKFWRRILIYLRIVA